ncbi:hypothetical protein [Chelativorans sp. Marseille-P2723]|uniref:hypothetical protein n=1 Tax=Chelativorans sp. Marseille-P2723 TaxID=2709133 RepID=UPI00156FAA4C|nr:hypothetical protein [Chelativorans sp. Marseille-P2723]
MSDTDFRHISFGQGLRNCEHVFRAALSAYCTLDRPTSYETAQLDDLAIGLFDAVPSEARRFAAAVLCDAAPAPPRLLRRLCDEPVEISAPLLLRSRALSDVDLIALISKHGLGHARIIARRNGLNPVIATLIRALVARAETAQEALGAEAPVQQEDGSLDEIRRRLRKLMQEEHEKSDADVNEATVSARLTTRDKFIALRESALASEGSRFTAALASALRLPPECARNLASGTTYSQLLVGLRAMELTPEEAFLLTALKFPAQVTHRSAIKNFLDRYESIDLATALRKVAEWREENAKFPALNHAALPSVVER